MSAVVDGRDLRDPKKLGESIAHAKSKYAFDSATGAHDMIEDEGIAIPRYSRVESTATETQRQYREELKARAAEGDKYAISMLTTGEPGDTAE